MHTRIIYQDAPSIAPEIQRELLSHDPATILLWNPAYRLESNGDCWEPRWEIWKALRPSRHPDATNQRYSSDMWNTSLQCWMRKLQTYLDIDGGFAAADRALIVGLELADAWASRTWYEETIEASEARAEEAQSKHIRDITSSARRYYHSITNPIVGRHVNSGWRWRLN